MSVIVNYVNVKIMHNCITKCMLKSAHVQFTAFLQWTQTRRWSRADCV